MISQGPSNAWIYCYGYLMYKPFVTSSCIVSFDHKRTQPIEQLAPFCLQALNMTWKRYHHYLYCLLIVYRGFWIRVEAPQEPEQRFTGPCQWVYTACSLLQKYLLNICCIGFGIVHVVKAVIPVEAILVCLLFWGMYGIIFLWIYFSMCNPVTIPGRQ